MIKVRQVISRIRSLGLHELDYEAYDINQKIPRDTPSTSNDATVRDFHGH